MMTLFLTGCGPARERQSFETLQQRLNAAEEIGCDAQITAVNGDEAVTFRVRLTRRERETCAVVTDPESIRDIAFRRKDGEETLEFDGLILSFSPAAEGAAAALCCWRPSLTAICPVGAGRGSIRPGRSSPPAGRRSPSGLQRMKNLCTRRSAGARAPD